MIRFYRHSEIDKEKWNRCVEDSRCPTIFADYGLLSIANPGWNALIEDDYRAIMPLPWRKKHGIAYIYTPFYISRLGIFSAEKPAPEKVAEFVSAIPRDFVQVDLHLNESNPANLLLQDANSLISHQLRMDKSYEEIFRGYAENTKRNVKAARKQGLTVDKNVDVDDVIAMFRQSSRGQDKSVRIKEMDYGVFLQMAAFAKERGLLDTWGARTSDGTLIAAASFLKDRQRTWFWASGRNEDYAKQKPMFFLIDEYLQHIANQDIIFDFNGSSNEGVARFYRQFGSERYTCPALHLTQKSVLGWLVRLYKSLKR